MKNILNVKIFLVLVLLLSLITLFSAYYIEYVMGIKPCKLCLYQRYPYFMLIFLSIIGLIFFQNKNILYLVILTFTVSLILSIYHTGIENNIFPEFTGCTSDNINIYHKEILLNSLNNIDPSCKDVTFRIFGLSLATINILISFILVVISLILLKYYEKNK